MFTARNEIELFCEGKLLILNISLPQRDIIYVYMGFATHGTIMYQIPRKLEICMYTGKLPKEEFLKEYVFPYPS